jgi:hypothetical protein
VSVLELKGKEIIIIKNRARARREDEGRRRTNS